jgi:Kdo2-lipid IVA lauroyltransferase/acyltransferase
MSAPTTLPFGKRLRFLAEALPFALFMGLFRLIGLDAASALGGFIGRHIFRRLPTANVARANLKAAYPAMTDAEIETIVRRVCDNLGRVTAEYPHLDKMTLGPGRRIEVEGAGNGDAAIAHGKGVMFISGHFANWEVMPITAMHLNFPGGLVYRPPNNPYVAAWISKQRGKLGPADQISKGAQGTRRIFTLLRRGKCIFMLVDQKTYEGVKVPFFGRDAMTTPAPASLALKMGAVLLPVRCERTKGAHFRVTIQPPLAFTPSGDGDADVTALTAAITARIETMVRADPAQWLWIHRRWLTPRDIEKMKKMGLS